MPNPPPVFPCALLRSKDSRTITADFLHRFTSYLRFHHIDLSVLPTSHFLRALALAAESKHNHLSLVELVALRNLAPLDPTPCPTSS